MTVCEASRYLIDQAVATEELRSSSTQVCLALTNLSPGCHYSFRGFNLYTSKKSFDLQSFGFLVSSIAMNASELLRCDSRNFECAGFVSCLRFCDIILLRHGSALGLTSAAG